jgi:hypothetical protein
MAKTSVSLPLQIVHLLVRRAKLGFASQGQVLTLEALAGCDRAIPNLLNRAT